VSPESKRPIGIQAKLNKGDLVKQSLGSDGYWRVNLKRESGAMTSHHIHRLLMLTFCPPPRDGLQVNHKDGIKTNNDLANLEWVTDRKNLHHAWVNKLRKQPVCAILIPDQVREIRATYVKGKSPTMREIGLKYGVTSHAIYRIVNNKNWKHV
jgi:hypothetical protein